MNRRPFGSCLAAFLLVSTIATFAGNPAGAGNESEVPTAAEQVVAAREILDPWHAGDRQLSGKKVHLVCWTPADRELPSDYGPRLTRIMLHIQEFYAREMQRHGFGERTFDLDRNDDGELVIHVAKGKLTFAKANSKAAGVILEDCRRVLKDAKVDPHDGVVMMFCNLATWDEDRLEFRHKSPYFASGDARRGRAWQLDSPELDTRNLTKTEPIIRDGEYGRISLGRHNSIFIGGIAHELGHALDLPHNKARRDEAVRGQALMGSGNRTYAEEVRGEGRGSFLTFAHALRLASHPQFSGSVKGVEQTPQCDVQELSFEVENGRLRVEGTISSKIPIYAVVAYCDPEGGGDYDATTATAIPDQQGRFRFAAVPEFRGKSGEIRIVPLHVNGRTSTHPLFTHKFQVGTDGSMNIDSALTRLELQPVIEAGNRGEKQHAVSLAENLRSNLAKEIARRLLSPKQPAVTPAGFDGNDDAVPLTNFRHDVARVGWSRPAFDRIPDRSVLLKSGDELFVTGIYAHAPARHRYNLGTRWGTITGRVGLADGYRGSVRFEILGDGKSLWTSETLRTGETIPFDVSVGGVTALELVTHPTPDGPRSDWGLWLEPTLHRPAPAASSN